MPEINPDDYEYLQEELINAGRRGGGGGSTGKKGDKTISSIRREAVERHEATNVQEASTRILDVISKFPKLKNSQEEDAFVQAYIDWVNRAFKTGTSLVMGSEVSKITSKSGGPGGQNVNKRETRVQLRHIPTNIRAESSETRDQKQNEAKAAGKLREQLQEHLQDWRIVLEGKTEVVVNDVINLMP
jgi:protein subunit release factor B